MEDCSRERDQRSEIRDQKVRRSEIGPHKSVCLNRNTKYY
jgi:hypothetical protein